MAKRRTRRTAPRAASRPTAETTVLPVMSPGVSAEVHSPQRDVVAPAEPPDVVVPVMEERLEVELNPVDRRFPAIDRRITEERQSIDVEVYREHLRVHRREVAARPVTEEEGRNAFAVGTVRVPVFGQRAAARKEPVVTGEVAVPAPVVPEPPAELESPPYAEAPAISEAAAVTVAMDTTVTAETAEIAEPTVPAETRGSTAGFVDGEHRVDADRDLVDENASIAPNSEGAAEERPRWTHIFEDVRTGFARARERAERAEGTEGG